MERTTMTAFLLAMLAVGLGCGPGDNRSSPYAGFRHSKPEHGYWKQVSPAVTPSIEELHLHEAGFSVTWHPFETYKDYWGTYEYVPGTSALALSISAGNYVPPDVVARGTLRLETPDRLVLEGAWLGSPKPGARIAPQTLVFERFRPGHAK